MSKRKDVDLIRDIVESIERIISSTRNTAYNDFVHDHKTQDAVIRNIEIMGEAVKSLSEKTRIDNANIPWNNIAGTRDKLIHDYFGVDIDEVWLTAKNDLPALKSRLEAIIKDLKES